MSQISIFVVALLGTLLFVGASAQQEQYVDITTPLTLTFPESTTEEFLGSLEQYLTENNWEYEFGAGENGEDNLLLVENSELSFGYEYSVVENSANQGEIVISNIIGNVTGAEQVNAGFFDPYQAENNVEVEKPAQ